MSDAIFLALIVMIIISVIIDRRILAAMKRETAAARDYYERADLAVKLSRELLAEHRKMIQQANADIGEAFELWDYGARSEALELLKKYVE